MENLLSRITLNPEICHGKPTIRNKRYMVADILSYLAAGDSSEDIISHFSDLNDDDIRACIAYAAEITKLNVTHLELK